MLMQRRQWCYWLGLPHQRCKEVCVLQEKPLLCGSIKLLLGMPSWKAPDLKRLIHWECMCAECVLMQQRAESNWKSLHHTWRQHLHLMRRWLLSRWHQLQAEDMLMLQWQWCHWDKLPFRRGCQMRLMQEWALSAESPMQSMCYRVISKQ